MAYRIEYENGDKYPSAAPERTSGVAVRAAGFFLLFLLLTQLFWPAGAEKLRQILMPWDAETTAEAFSVMVSDLRQGDDISEAVTAFCREIMMDAEAAD